MKQANSSTSARIDISSRVKPRADGFKGGKDLETLLFSCACQNGPVVPSSVVVALDEQNTNVIPHPCNSLPESGDLITKEQ